jgi:hypothetical protein
MEKGIRYIRQAETLEGMGKKIRDAENISRQECCTAQQQQMLNKKRGKLELITMIYRYAAYATFVLIYGKLSNASIKSQI